MYFGKQFFYNFLKFLLNIQLLNAKFYAEFKFFTDLLQ